MPKNHTGSLSGAFLIIFIPASSSFFMPGQKTYNTAASAWPRSGRLVIESVLDTLIAKFPLNFLETCGDNTWVYVSYVISLLVEPDPRHPGAIIDPESGRPVNPNDIPVAGTFKYIEEGAPAIEHLGPMLTSLLPGKSSDVHFARGPTYYTTVVPASGQEGTSGPGSTRSSADQVRKSLASSICCILTTFSPSSR